MSHLRSGVVALARRVRWEQKQFWRNPAAAAFTFAFPLMFLVIFVAINGNGEVTIDGGRVRFAQYYVPAIIAFGLISACYTNLAFSLSVNRENGILKRLRGTPLAPSTYLAGVVSNVIVIGLILTALTTALGLLFYRVSFPNRYFGLAVSVAAAGLLLQCPRHRGVDVRTQRRRRAGHHQLHPVPPPFHLRNLRRHQRHVGVGPYRQLLSDPAFDPVAGGGLQPEDHRVGDVPVQHRCAVAVGGVRNRHLVAPVPLGAPPHLT